MEDVAALVGCLWLTLLMATAWAVSVAKDRWPAPTGMAAAALAVAVLLTGGSMLLQVLGTWSRAATGLGGLPFVAALALTLVCLTILAPLTALRYPVPARYRPALLAATAVVLAAQFVSWGLVAIRTEALVTAARQEALTLFVHETPDVSDSDNAAALYQRAAERLRPYLYGQVDWPAAVAEALEQLDLDPTEVRHDSPFGSSRLEEALVALEPGLEAVRQAARLRACRWPRRDKRPSPDEPIFEAAYIRELARLTAVDAVHAAVQSDAARALDRLRTLAQMVRHVSQSPEPVSALLAAGIDSVFHAALEKCLWFNTDLCDQSVDLPTLSPSGVSPMLQRFLRGQEAILVWTVGDVYSGEQLYRELPEPMIGSLMWRLILVRSELRAANVLCRSVTSLQSPGAAHQEAEEVRNRWSLAAPLVSSEFEPTIASRVAFLAMLARRRLAQAALAAYRYRQAHRALPASWNDLVPSPFPSAPQDPFVDGPLHLTPVGHHLVLYSVGADETDNGGTSRQLDIVFKVRGLDQ